ncbi:mitochondrial import inner membrane translocase subunit Tim21-like [Betta splendens]|uniref:Mitochondrial import inner membrane translocase subunit Tim21 n=1 Tax=Betta splendens TaxID=158456 RepID=A0A6P7M525_BETSP|nr:mitochondrial import inner membrane translocase subunit Tim21-like [Betta splendens]XP_040926220.1 mitochondrial import inner membrane translocase subunit Tim21-like [Betta splendens]XP_055364027.1 mitochondrial import inner membrane translocase subunit Tim21-like [Betta splendens]
MAYAQIVKALRQTATRFRGQTCRLAQVSFVHTHGAVSTASRLTFLGRADAPVSALSCFVQAQPLRTLSLQCANRNKSSPEQSDRSVSRYQRGSPKPSAAQKVKDAGRDFTYLIVVLIGLGVTGGLLYVVFQELFSSSSPNKVYGKAFNIVKSHPEVIGAFGEPIKCYGETTRRGRRQQVSHLEYLKDGLKHMRLKFYIEGSEPGLKGTVHSESKEDPETGKYVFRYIFVDIDTYPRRTIIVEDNR